MNNEIKRWPTLLAVAAACVLSACGGGDDGGIHPGPVAVSPAPEPMTIREGSLGLVYRYVDPESGGALTTMSASSIPEGASKQVIVLDPDKPAPAGWDHVVDLSNGFPAVSAPQQGFRLEVTVATPIAAGPAAGADPAGAHVAPSRARGGQRQVVMFSSAGCGYCVKARSFFKKNRVPFTEYDLGRDPSASKRLAELGAKAGMSQRDMTGVPIIFVDGKPMKGFNQRGLKKMLGI